MDKKNEPGTLHGPINIKKDSEGKKFLKLFFTGSIKDALKYAFDNVFVPYTKDAICKTSTHVINYWVNGDRVPLENRNGATRVSYWRDGYTRSSVQPVQPVIQKQTNDIYSTGDVDFETYGKAEAALMRLKECIDVYSHATVADLYDIGCKKYSYTDHNYGWKDLSKAQVIRGDDGKYYLDLPKAIPLK